MRFLGFPLARYIDMDDAEKVLFAIRTTPPDKPIDLILHTPGGLVIAAVQIARALEGPCRARHRVRAAFRDVGRDAAGARRR